MKTVGTHIRTLRQNKALFLRQVASALDMDQAILSKIERGERRATRQQIDAISHFFNIQNNELLIAWLSDKVYYQLKDEEVAQEVLKAAEHKILYKN